MFSIRKIIVRGFLVVALIGLVGCSETEKQEDIVRHDISEKSLSYEEKVIEFEPDRQYGPFVMGTDDSANVGYIALEQEQLTDDLKTQSYIHTYAENDWHRTKTKWGGLLKKELAKKINLKNRIYKTTLSIGADGNLYATYNFYHPNAILENKGVDYEYFVSNLLFRIDSNKNKVTYVEIPEASKSENNEGINPLKCTAFSDGKLLIEDGKNAYVYDSIAGKKICGVEQIVNGGNYVAGDGAAYSAHVDSDGKFKLCEYNENDGRIRRKVSLNLYNEQAMSNLVQYKLKVYEYDLYLVCKEGIYRLREGQDEFERVVDGVRDNLHKMTNKDERIYDFAILGDEKFAVDYRKLTEDKNDFDTYDTECLVIYEHKNEEKGEEQ